MQVHRFSEGVAGPCPPALGGLLSSGTALAVRGDLGVLRGGAFTPQPRLCPGGLSVRGVLDAEQGQGLALSQQPQAALVLFVFDNWFFG